MKTRVVSGRVDSWRCLATEGDGSVVVELSRYVSSMFPRALLGGYLVAQPGGVSMRVGPPSDVPVIGPSGHRYLVGFEPEWVKHLSVLSRPEQTIVVTVSGIDLDTAEAISKATFDMLVHLLTRRNGPLTDQVVQEVLETRIPQWGPLGWPSTGAS